MPSESRVDDSPTIPPLSLTTIAGLDLKSFMRCFAKFPDPVLLTDGQARLIFMNSAAEDLLGYTVKLEEHRPLCTDILQTESKEENPFFEESLRGKQPLNRVPIRLRNNKAKGKK